MKSLQTFIDESAKSKMDLACDYLKDYLYDHKEMYEISWEELKELTYRAVDELVVEKTRPHK